MLGDAAAQPGGGLSLETLAENGYLNPRAVKTDAGQ